MQFHSASTFRNCAMITGSNNGGITNPACRPARLLRYSTRKTPGWQGRHEAGVWTWGSRQLDATDLAISVWRCSDGRAAASCCRETTRDAHPGPAPQRRWREGRCLGTKSRKLQEKVLAK